MVDRCGGSGCESLRMAGRIAAIVVGSGISGAIVFNPDARATLGDFIGGGKQSTSAGSDLSAVRELVSNVEKLSDAYKGSGGMPPTVTVIDAGGGGGGGDLRLALIGAGLSAVSIMSLLLYFKGKMLTNLLWISKKNFGTTLNKVHDNIEALTAHMQSLRNELTTKIFTVSRLLCNHGSGASRREEGKGWWLDSLYFVTVAGETSDSTPRVAPHL